MEQRSSKIFKLVFLEIWIIAIIVVLFIITLTDNQNIKGDIDKLKQASVDTYNYSEIDEQIKIYSDIETSLKNRYDEYYTNIATLEQKIMNKETDVKIAYLTFDDGPYDLTYKVLDKLKENNIRATFFVIGKNGVDDRYKRIVEEGHTLANHTYSHGLGKGLYNSVDSFMTQVKKLEEYLYNLTGYTTTLVRFPGGSPTAGKLKDGIVEQLHANGYKYVDWTSETGDGSDLKLKQKGTYQWFLDTTQNQNIIVLLMHDYNASTYNDLQKIIDNLKSRNFIFLPLHNKSIMAK